MADKFNITYTSSCTPVTIDEYSVADAELADGSADTAFNTIHTRRLVKSSHGAVPSGGASQTAPTNTTDSKVCGSGTITSGKHFCTDNSDYDITTTTASIGKGSAFSNAGNTSISGDLSFVAFRIRAVNTSDQTASAVNALISLDNGSTFPIKLVGVGDGIVIPLDDLASTSIHVKSTAENTCCFLQILAMKA